jgi:hypothetical protein
MFDPQMLAMAAGFLAPTQTGGFGESLSNAAKGVLQAGEAEQKQEQERAKGLLEIAQLKGQIAERKRIEKQYEDYFKGQQGNKTVTAGKEETPPGIKLFEGAPELTEVEFMADKARQGIPLADAKKEWNEFLRKQAEVKESGVFINGRWIPTSTEIINVPFLSDGKTYPLSKAEAAQHQALKSAFASAKGDDKAIAFNALEDFENRYNAPVPEEIRTQAKALRAAPPAKTEAPPPLTVPLPAAPTGLVTESPEANEPPLTTPSDMERVTTAKVDPSRFQNAQPQVSSQSIAPAVITSRPINVGPPPALAPAPVPVPAPAPAAPAPKPQAFAPVQPAAPAGRPPATPTQSFQGIQSIEAQEERKREEEINAARRKREAELAATTANVPAQSAAQQAVAVPEAIAKAKADRETDARKSIYTAEQTSGDTIATASQFKKYAADPNAKLMFGILKDNSISSGVANLIKEALRVGDYSIGVPAIEEVMRNANLSPQDQAKYRAFLQLTANMQLSREQSMKGATSGKEREILASASISPDDNPLAIEMKSNILIARANFDRWVARNLDASGKSAIDFKRSKEYSQRFDSYIKTLENLISGKTKLVPTSEAGATGSQAATSSAAREYANRLAGIR